MSQSDIFDNTPVFQLKGGTIAATVLELQRNALMPLESQLADKVAQAPQLFQGSPLILGLDKLAEEDGPLDLSALLAVCQRQGLRALAVRAVRPQDIAAAQAQGLAVLPAGRGRDRALEAVPEVVAPAPAAPEPVAIEPVAAPALSSGRPSLLITQPVRGGQQIYAEGADLIVLAPVSAGAELIADGHIHVYGVLRGRALAGVRGDEEARVFCQQMQAELVSVAGHYHVAEELRGHKLWGQSVQVSLTNGVLNLASL